ncbi:MAG: phosphotransferase [bacterium]|nr:phosphotransferase [bacterium]
MLDFQKRIGFSDDIKPLLRQIIKDYRLGKYLSHNVIPVGYEDFNLAVNASCGRYFIKIFAAYRNKENCKRYIKIIELVLARGVQHPKLLKSSRGVFYETRYGNLQVRLCVMQHIDGMNLYDLNSRLNLKEQKFLIKEAARINKIKFKPKFIYDSWAVSNFLKEFKKKRKYLDAGSKKILDLLAKKFLKLRLATLPHCLVHGDIIKTNVLKSKIGKLFIIDFSVSNYYPRIQELAVLLCSCLFDELHPKNIERQRDFAIKEYQKHIRLTDKEIAALPIFCDAAHAMHILQATYEKKVRNNNSQENAYWLKLGKIGLGI